MRTQRLDEPLDATDRFLVNRLQDGLPIVHAPFADVAREAGLSEAELARRVASLRERGAITRFGPFIDAAALGGAFCLCAMAVPHERFETVVTLVNAHDEVAHNYERQHRLNMWFVLACERPEDIRRTAARIEAETGLKVHLFPKLKEFFVGFRVTL
ncbi:MAG: AsnC family transcriptional regulator [Paracoccaceae bacterium]